MSSKTFKTTIVREGSMCFIPLTFDPKSVFGKIRAPVKVTYRSTIAAIGGPPCIPLRRSNREAAGLEGGDRRATRSRYRQTRDHAACRLRESAQGRIARLGT